MMLMATATDLLVIFLALEVLSLAVYVLTGIRRDSPTATEAALKYFLLGAFASAFFLYGIAFTYGLTGSTRLDRIGGLMAAQAMAPTPMQLLAVGPAARRVRVQGVGGAVPHVDARRLRGRAAGGHRLHVHRREGGGVRGVRARVPLGVRAAARRAGAPVVWVIAAATMIVGTVVGVAQTNVKRMLAYSSIAHGGYLLVALVAANDVGKGAVLFYLLTYAITNLGAFGVIALLENADRPNDEVRDYAGLWNDHPALAALMTMFLLSLGGFPPLGRLHREVVRLQRRGEGRLHLARDHRRAHQRRLGLLLPADRRHDVHDAERDRRRDSRAVPRMAGAALIVSAILVVLSRHPADARHRLGRGVDRDDLLSSRQSQSDPKCLRSVRAFDAGTSYSVTPDADVTKGNRSSPPSPSAQPRHARSTERT